jgi:hypothetical protein
MKRIVPPKPLELKMAAPKEPLKEGEEPAPPKTLSMVEFLTQAVMTDPAWLQTAEANSSLGEILEAFEDAPDGPWDVSDAARETLLAVMKTVQNDVTQRIAVPKILRFYSKMLGAVFAAATPPAEKQAPEKASPEPKNGAAAAQA